MAAEEQQQAGPAEQGCSSIEYTLAMIKPDAVAAGKAAELLQLIELAGFIIIARRQMQVQPHMGLQGADVPRCARHRHQTKHVSWCPLRDAAAPGLVPHARRS